MKKITILTFILFSFNLASAGETRSRYDDVVKFMQDLATAHPENVEVFDLGPSDSGQTIKGLKIGHGPLLNLLVSTHHGNEYGSTEVAKAFAASLALKPIDGQTLYVIPVLNISGYNKLQREESASGQSFDPNRNYPGPCGTEGPFTLKSIKAMADFLDHNHIVTSATLHTYYPGVFYPWGVATKQLDTGYTSTFLELGNAATYLSNYPVENTTLGVYPVDGSYEDYAFWKHGIWSLLFELGYSHNPSPSEVAQLVAQNVPGLRKMYEQSPAERAPNHEFKGTCDSRISAILDRHDE